MIVGQTVVVERRTETGRDPGNNPVWEWVSEDVENVLVAPGSLSDVVGTIRPDGVDIRYTLFFPKGYPETLANARVRIGSGPPLTVVGRPSHYPAVNTPGQWSMVVEVGAVEG